MKLSEDEAKRFLERLCPLQETEQHLLCPRCGRNELYSGLYYFLNSLSRCCFSKRMRKVFKKNEKSMLQFCNKNSKKKRAFTMG